MTRSAAFGRAGEEAAARYLAAAGFAILARNWRQGSLELDIVCREKDTLVFVEVRSRASGALVTAAESLGPGKRRSLFKAVRAYLAAYNAWDQPCRVDLICVTGAAPTSRPATSSPASSAASSASSAPSPAATDLADLRLEHLRHVLEFKESLDRRHTAWQPW